MGNRNLTNAFTVLSVRIIGDMNLDGSTIDSADWALLPTLSHEYGWRLPAVPENRQKIRLRNEVCVTGDHTLQLTGTVGTFRLWQSATPEPDEMPLLECGETITNGNGVTFLSGINSDIYVEALTDGAATLTYTFQGTGAASDLYVTASLPLTAVEFGMVPDCDRNRIIDSNDHAQSATKRIQRWWINDDADAEGVYTGESGIPGQFSPNHADSVVNGTGDLLDFFPIWLNLHDLLRLWPQDEPVQYKLRQDDDALKAVYTDLARNEAGSYLTVSNSACGPAFNQPVHAADTFPITSSGVTLASTFIEKIRDNADKGILLLEGAATTEAPLVLEVWRGEVKIFQRELQLSIDGVEKMYRWVNLRGVVGGGAERVSATNEPPNMPDAECNDVNVFFTHGFLVGEQEARAWGSEFFKKLYQEGSNARFWMVTWRSDEATSIDYYLNVNNAFNTASNLSQIVNNLDGSKIFMTHSLGNMLVSSAIADHNMQLEKYFALNAAIAAEAFDISTVNTETSASNYLLHENWIGYSNRTWSACWHELFGAVDDRSRLTWRNRFANVLEKTALYNFWSSGDEVLEICTSGTPFALGFLWPPWNLGDSRQYVWHKQEAYKGRSAIYGTTWAGWAFSEWGWCDEYTLGLPRVFAYSAATANGASDNRLRQDPVFTHSPSMLFQTNIAITVRNQILADGIPALSYPVGGTQLLFAQPGRNIDMQTTDLPNGWGRADDGLYGQRWLHSDVMYMPYFYTYKLYDLFVTQGDMR